ncbi:MAG: reprolysin-like metallopeptidase [Bacteroidota bacterium]
MRYYFLSGLLILAGGLFAQTSAFYFDAQDQLLLRNASVVELLADLPTIDHNTAPPTSHELTLPTPNGEAQTFYIWKTAVADAELSARFPGIVTLGGMVKDNPSIKLRGEWTNENGKVAPNANGSLSVMIFDPKERWVIRPIYGTDVYEMGTETDFAHLRQHFECMLDGHEGHHGPSQQTQAAAPYPIGEELRTYRMAVATTPGYSDFFGNDTSSVLAGIMASVNRISEVYERDASVTFTLIDETTEIIFIGTGPLSGSSPLGTVHAVIRDSIGLNNFDIGHLVDIGGGGVASLGSVCTSNRKGSGYTSLSPPQGDPFDIDYFAHEVGHQFNANHSFNGIVGSCNQRFGPTAYEPGSGVTIMGYAGICGTDNVALRSIPQLHAISILEMTQFTQFGIGDNCPTVTMTGNAPPTVEPIIPPNVVIPPETPFELEATGSDPNTPDAITYSWEQYQTGPGVNLGDASGNSPLFRNFNATSTPVRVFPRMARILENPFDPRELLADYDRNLSFRVVARDNSPGGGGIFWDDMDAQVRESGGPFSVTSQNEVGQELLSGDVVILNWERGNTHQAPFSTDSLDVTLSADPVAGFDIELGRVANTGTGFVVLPDVPTDSTYRFKLKGVDRLWFAINGEDAIIAAPDGQAISLNNLQDELNLCGTGTLELDFFLSRLNGASGDIQFEVIGLPAEVQTEVTETDLLPGRSFQLELTIGNDVPDGDYNAQLVATLGALTDTFDFRAVLQVAALTVPTNIIPADEEVEVSVSGPFEWTDSGSLGERTYDIQIGFDPTGNSWDIEEFGLTDTFFTPAVNLDENTVYFWRVRTVSAECGDGPWSDILSFTTESLACLTFTPDDVPVEMNNSVFITSTINIDEDFPVRSVRIPNARGIYDNFGELRFLLLTPGAGAINLTQTSGCQTNNFNLGFSDAGGNLICSQVNTGNLVRPIEPFSDARNSSTDGNWRLRIFDQSNEGQLSSWELEICVPERLVSTRNTPLAQTKVRVFPNPGHDILYFRWSELPTHPQLIVLTDINGREVSRLQGRQPRDAYQLSVDANRLPQGIYIYRMLTEDGQLLASGRWVKQ